MEDILRGIGSVAAYIGRRIQTDFRILFDRDFAQQFAQTVSAMTEYAHHKHPINSRHSAAWELVSKNDLENMTWLKIRVASMGTRDIEGPKPDIREALDILEAGYKNKPQRFSLREFWAAGQELAPELRPIERELRTKPEARALFDKTLEDMGTLKSAFETAGETSYPFPDGLVTAERDGNARFLLLRLAVDARRGEGVLMHNLQHANDGYNELIKQYG